VHFGDISGNWETFYKPNPGSYLIDVGVLVKNNSKDVVQVKWGNVYVVEESGDAWFPNWGSIKSVNPGVKLDPFTIGLSSVNLVAEDMVNFEKDTYMRLIFVVAANPDQIILFGIEGSPMIGFKIKK